MTAPANSNVEHEGSTSVNTAGTARLATMAVKLRSTLIFALLDATVIVCGYGLAEVASLRERAPAFYWHKFLLFVIVALVVHLCANRLFGLYGRIWRQAGVEEARSIVAACATSLAVLLAFYPLGRHVRLVHVPIQILPLGCLLTMVGIGVLRFHSRLLGWQHAHRGKGLRVGVVCSGDAGASVVREVLRNPTTGLIPVAIFDDDRRSHGLSLIGVPVVGPVDELPSVARRLGIQQVLLAVAEPPAQLVERCLRAAEAAEIVLKIIPGVHEIVGSVTSAAVSIRSAREPRIEDLIGRSQVEMDLTAVRNSLEGRRVLVTGAGGSIGAEICRQVGLFEPELLVLLDHDETHLHEIASELGCKNEQILADVANRARVSEVFSRFEPEIVFHAAAHKHVPILEAHVVEAVSTNVLGSLNVIDAASLSGSERFVFVSTDKAVRPVSVMGATKQLGERLLLSRAPKGGAYCAVRFGNVLGSRGSVIPTFQRQIASGGPVTVTDPHMMRFFMSVEEAVHLVLQASIMAARGDVFVLEMGKPVRILDLARRMIRLSGFNPDIDIPIRFVGMRPGERLREELHGEDERLTTTDHPSIRRLARQPVELLAERLDVGVESLNDAVRAHDDVLARRILFDLISDVESADDMPGFEPERISCPSYSIVKEEGVPA